MAGLKSSLLVSMITEQPQQLNLLWKISCNKTKSLLKGKIHGNMELLALNLLLL